PTPVEPVRPVQPSQIPMSGQSNYPAGPPRFEPIITGKVALAGLMLAAVVVGVVLLLGIG
ncbi:MAG: hypothetical protein M3380_03385, partial [Chloroflexota bacterium]|nr:hypothetical protein [Chloroflexota bacterium]